MKYQFKAKDIKTNEWVTGDLVYVHTVGEKKRIKPMILTVYGKGGMVWARDRHIVDENTIELIKE